MKRAVFALPLILFFTVALYFAVSLRPGHDPQILPSALIDEKAPDFQLAALKHGPDLARDVLAGQVVLINFFASWCEPCRQEHALLMRLGGTEHLPLYGIAYKDEPGAASLMLKQLGDPYRSVGIDRDGRAGIDFGVYGVPETYVIDKAGYIRKRFVGPLSPERLANELLPLVKELAGS